MEMGKRWEKQKWNQLSIYTRPPPKKKGFLRISAPSSVSQTHKFKEIINRILSCRSPLIQPSQPLLGWATLAHERPHVWWRSPLHKIHLEQKFFVRALETCNVKEGEICNIKEGEIVKISANVVTFKCHF